MLDLDLLRSFVSVVDAGGFTRAGERVHRTQSTVSQQIRRLEEGFGRPLLHRDGKRIRPTEEGKRLLSYARRILALAEEARDVVSRPSGDGVVRLGLPEDFAAYRLTEMLSEFARSRPGLRLYVRCGKSDRMRRALERGELDLALFKRDAEETGGIAAWPERLHWVTSHRRPVDLRRDPLPLGYSSRGAFTAIGRSMRSRRWGALGTSPTRVPVFSAFRPLSPRALASASCPRSPFFPSIPCWMQEMAFRPSPTPRWHSLRRRRRTQPAAGLRKPWPTSAALSIGGWRRDWRWSGADRV